MTDLEPEALDRQDEDVEALDVLDLPQLYTRPSAETILTTLADLSSEPISWDAIAASGIPHFPQSGTSTTLKRRKMIRSEGVPGYLTRIISSPLTWIEDDGEKEMIWESASQRLSERSGRTGMGAMNRTFTIPLATISDSVNITLHEPALTADNLGLKTWGSSYLLAKRLVLLREMLVAANKSAASNKQILELGAGTGLVGIAAAFVLQKDVLLTDLPTIVPNLERNARENTRLALQTHGNIDVAVLDWSEPTSIIVNGSSLKQRIANSFPIILAADAVYDIEHATLLPHAVAALLAKDKDARAVIELPLRDAFVTQRQLFRQNMDNAGLVIEEQGEEVGFDDWSASSHGDELAEVTCWWSVWRWQ
nr:protein-lysine n-methyltransferase rrg1 [Quercus suber]